MWSWCRGCGRGDCGLSDLTFPCPSPFPPFRWTNPHGQPSGRTSRAFAMRCKATCDHSARRRWLMAFSAPVLRLPHRPPLIVADHCPSHRPRHRRLQSPKNYYHHNHHNHDFDRQSNRCSHSTSAAVSSSSSTLTGKMKRWVRGVGSLKEKRRSWQLLEELRAATTT